MISRRTKRLVIGFGCLIFLVAIILFSVARYFANAAEQRRYAEEKAALAPRAQLRVEVVRRDVERERRMSAEVLPWYAASVAAEVTGRVVEVKVNAGTVVAAGDPLVVLDSAMSKLEKESAQAQLSAAAAEMAEAARLEKESRDLSKRGVISKTELAAARSRAQVAQATVERLEAELGRLEEMLGRHVVAAPFEGIVRARVVDVGDAVNVNQPVAEVVQIDPLRVVFSLNENEVSAVEQGGEVRVQLPEKPGDEFHAEVVQIGRSADPVTRLFRVEAKLENPGGKLLSGTEAVVFLTLERSKQQLVLPTSAVRLIGREAWVERLRKGEDRADRVQVRIGPETDGYYPVLKGLDEGDRLIVR